MLHARRHELQRVGEIGDLIAGTVNLQGAPGPDDRVRVGLFDRRGRLLEQTTLNPADDLSFAFTIKQWMPMLVRVDAALYRNPAGAAPAQTIHSAYSYCRVTKRHQGRFNFLMWDVPKGTLAPYAEQSLAENAVKAPAPPRLMMVCGTEDRLYPGNIRLRDHLQALKWPDLQYRE